MNCYCRCRLYCPYATKEEKGKVENVTTRTVPSSDNKRLNQGFRKPLSHPITVAGLTFMAESPVAQVEQVQFRVNSFNPNIERKQFQLKVFVVMFGAKAIDCYFLSQLALLFFS